MKVFELLSEIEEICDTSAGVPFSSKIMIDKTEMLEIAKEIRQILPEEVTQAQFVMNERQRILDQAKHEYELLIKDAEKQSEMMVSQHEITTQAKQRAKELLEEAQRNCTQLKMSTFEFVDKTLYDFQTQVDDLQGDYFRKMFQDIQGSLDAINAKLAKSRDDVKDLAYKTQVEGEEAFTQ
jgi:hypothetical protein